MTKPKDEIIRKIDHVFLTIDPIDRNRGICFQIWFSEKEMRLIKMRLKSK